MKIITIVGARPQFIKAALLSNKIRKTHNEVIIHTGQHYHFELSKVFFLELKIPQPNYFLKVGSATHGVQTGKMLIRMEDVIVNEKPDLVILYGDTNSTIAGAICASKLKIPIMHIESGIRNFEKNIPEEINRIVTDHLSTYLIASTKIAVNNLRSEGISDNIFLTGDIMIDLLLKYKSKAKHSSILEKNNISPNDYYLATMHRPINTDNKRNLTSILSAFKKIKRTIIIPLHPRTLKMIKQFNLMKYLDKNIQVIKPVGYIDFLCLQINSKKIITDSGGIQKEAYVLKKPCITLYKNTGWVETVNDKWNILVGHNKEKIIDAIKHFNPSESQTEDYGRGKATDRILNIINKM